MNIQTKTLLFSCGMCSLVILISSCAWTHKYEPKEFGSSVRTMVKSQIYDRSTIKNPPVDVVEGMDSTKAIGDLRKVYRKSEGNKQNIKLIKLPGADN